MAAKLKPPTIEQTKIVRLLTIMEELPIQRIASLCEMPWGCAESALIDLEYRGYAAISDDNWRMTR